MIFNWPISFNNCDKIDKKTSVGQNFENFETFRKIPTEINFRKMVTKFFFRIYSFRNQFFRKYIRKFRKILNFHGN